MNAEAAKTVLQVVAVASGLFILGMVFHKAHADISMLAEQHSGARFWWALASYFLRNIAGG